MKVNSLILFILCLFLCSCSIKKYLFGDSGKIYLGSMKEKIDEDYLIDKIGKGTVILIGEHHYVESIQKSQIRFIKNLYEKNPNQKISIAIEFIPFKHQENLDLYLNKKINEKEFLRRIDWKKKFILYKELVELSKITNGKTIGINMPRSILKKVAKVGPNYLTQNEKNLIPKDFLNGLNENFLRFKNHLTFDGKKPIPKESLRNYFLSQSISDHTMSKNIFSFHERHRDHILIVVLDEFNMSYGLGLTDRLKRLKVSPLLTISQLLLPENDEEREEMIQPHYQYGQRADFLWLFDYPY